MGDKSLIICPVGIPMTFKDDYDKENHWRYTNKLDRKYETLVVSYNGFVPEPDTFDHFTQMKGHKWQIMKKIPEIMDLSRYKYIACVDDDLITDIHSFNEGLTYAEAFDFRLWQLSMLAGSGITYPCLVQNKECDFSETNFIEMGSPFFRYDIFVKLVDFLKELDFTVGWGIDKMFCDVLETTAHVVHSSSIYHPPNHIKPSYYDQGDAHREMGYNIDHVYPRIMRDKYNKPDWKFRDSQVTLNMYKLTR